MEAIYFATFKSGMRQFSDRRLYVRENPSLEEFHRWIEVQRKQLEKEVGLTFVVVNINYIVQK